MLAPAEYFSDQHTAQSGPNWEDTDMTRTPLKLPAIATVAAVPLILLSTGSGPAYADDVALPTPAPSGVDVGPEVEIGPGVEIGSPAESSLVDDLLGVIGGGSDLGPLSD